MTNESRELVRKGLWLGFPRSQFYHTTGISDGKTRGFLTTAYLYKPSSLCPSQHIGIIQLSPLPQLNAVSYLNYYIGSFIFMYCSCEGNLGITYTLKILTSFSLIPNTLLALHKCLRTALNFLWTHGCFELWIFISVLIGTSWETGCMFTIHFIQQKEKRA